MPNRRRSRIEVAQKGRCIESTARFVLSRGGRTVGGWRPTPPSPGAGGAPQPRIAIAFVAPLMAALRLSRDATSAGRSGYRRRRWLLPLAFVLLGLVPAATAAAQTQSPAPPPRDIIVAVKESPPFAMRTQQGNWTGISIELWDRIAQRLGVSTTYRAYNTVPEMLAAVDGGGANAAVAAISVTPEREKTLDFTQPFYNAGLGIAVPADKDIEWFYILRNIFTFRFLEAICALIAGAIIVGALIWLLERRVNEQYAKGVQGFGTSLWWSASAMAQAAAADKAPGTLWGRMLGMLWLIASIVAVASFTAGVTSHLAARRFASVVRTSSDLAAVRTGSIPATNASDYLRAAHIDVRSYPSVAAGLNALKAGKLDAFVYDRPILEWTVHKGYIDDVQVLDKLFVRDNYAIALPKGAAMRTSIDVAMGEEMRDPWWQDLLVRYLGTGE